VKVLWGQDFITDTIGPFTFMISPRSFFQVNNVQTQVLYNKALEYAALTGQETVVDAYCGIGTISLFLAQKAKKVIGIEIVPEAVADAKRNAELNALSNVEFSLGKVEEILPVLVKKGLKPQVVTLDPPRKGCDPALLDSIIQVKPERIVYVSCNPSTLARDLKYLALGGYGVEEVQPVDMFPMTGHVEAIILMTRSGSGDKK
jgi:23S rRNA (uracil1939-C5)-methyltransferase